MNMRILIASDMILSPYMRELARGYAAHDCEVIFGVQNFWTPYCQCDALHLHWPETLFKQLLGPPNEVALTRLRECLESWRRRVPIIATVHNLHPHESTHAGYREAYKLVYETADLLIHHGQSSVKIIAEQYPDALEKSVVVPHGHFACLDSGLSREEARAQLGIDEKYRKIIVTTGAIRSRNEFQLLIRGYRGARIQSKHLITAGPLPFGRFSKTLKPFIALLGISAYPGFLPDETITRYVAAADVMVVIRPRGLNSGVVMLGLSLGKVVVGSSYGVPGEVLEYVGNPVYDPQSHRSLSRALEKGIELADAGVGEKNRETALSEWSWEDIAKKLIDAIVEVKQRRSL